MMGRDDEALPLDAGTEAPAWLERALRLFFARSFCEVIEQAQVLCAEDDEKHMGNAGYTRGQFMLENLGQAAHRLLVQSWHAEGQHARALSRLLGAIRKYRDGDEGADAGMQSDAVDAQRAAVCWTDNCLREIFAAASELEEPGQPFGEWASEFLGGISRAALLRELAQRTPELRRYKQLAGEAARGDQKVMREWDEASEMLAAKFIHELTVAVDLRDIKPADGWRDLRLVLEMDLEVMELQQAARDMATPPLESAVAQDAARNYDRLFRAVEERMRSELLRVARAFTSEPGAEGEND